MHEDFVTVLLEAVTKIGRLRGKLVLVKIGGNVLGNETSKTMFAKSIVFLKYFGMKPLVVHGGGPEITALMEKLGMKPVFKNGFRVTDEKTMEIVEMVLNKTNKDLVAAINVHENLAIGICGKDGNLLICEKDTQHGDIGYVGRVKSVNGELVWKLLDMGYIPVIAPIGVDENGTSYNVNADVAAAQIAIALKAETVIFMTDVDGVVKDGKVLPSINVEEAMKLIEEGTVKGGMIPKLLCAVEAVKNGVKSAHIVNGNEPRSLLGTLLDVSAVGTIITSC